MNEPQKQALGARLKHLRTRQGLTQTTAAKAAQVHPNTWRTWEQGHEAYRSWRAPLIAAALGVPIAQLFVDDLVLAEIRVSEETLAAVRDEGRAASEAAAARISGQLEPLIYQAATRPAHDGRPQRRRTRTEKLRIPRAVRPPRRQIS